MKPTVPFENKMLLRPMKHIRGQDLFYLPLRNYDHWMEETILTGFHCYSSLGVRNSEDGAIALIPQLIPDQMPLRAPKVASLVLQNIKCAFPMGRSYSKQMKYTNPWVIYFTVLKFLQFWSNVVHFDYLCKYLLLSLFFLFTTYLVNYWYLSFFLHENCKGLEEITSYLGYKLFW